MVKTTSSLSSTTDPTVSLPPGIALMTALSWASSEMSGWTCGPRRATVFPSSSKNADGPRTAAPSSAAKRATATRTSAMPTANCVAQDGTCRRMRVHDEQASYQARNRYAGRAGRRELERQARDEALTAAHRFAGPEQRAAVRGEEDPGQLGAGTDRGVVTAHQRRGARDDGHGRAADGDDRGALVGTAIDAHRIGGRAHLTEHRVERLTEPVRIRVHSHRRDRDREDDVVAIRCTGPQLVDHVDDVGGALVQAQPRGFELPERGEVIGEEHELLGPLREPVGDRGRDAGDPPELGRELAQWSGDLVLEDREEAAALTVELGDAVLLALQRRGEDDREDEHDDASGVIPDLRRHVRDRSLDVVGRDPGEARCGGHDESDRSRPPRGGEDRDEVDRRERV